MDNTEFKDKWNLAQYSDQEIDQACGHFKDLFGLTARNAPSTTGAEFLRILSLQRGAAARLVNPGNLGTFAQHGPRAVIWIRPIELHEMNYDGLYAYDKRGSYLNATDCYLGYGPHFKRSFEAKYTGQDFLNDRKNSAGVWKIQFDELPQSPFHRTVYSMLAGRNWFYTPMVTALAQLDFSFRILEGREFDQAGKLMNAWKIRINEALEIENKTRPAIRSMIKAMYTQTIGLFGSDLIKDKENDRSWYRPDWRGQIVDTATARMLFNVQKVNSLYPILPAAVYDDCLYYLANDGRPIHEVFTRHDQRLASMFRYKGAYDITSDAARNLFREKPAIFARDIKKYRKSVGSDWLLEGGE